ncbi:hypothetical protein [Streptomyces sp. NPDC047042]|uniref:hypothetical protein n=1 Tax=Streptomyces sp. NPDC047042 TaxID=3154807 RepID=UPI0033E33B0F
MQAPRDFGDRIPGSKLCGDCLLALTATLVSLPGLYEECGRVLSGTRTRRWEERPSGGGALRGIPLNTAAADARSAMLRMLASWSGLVVDERGVAAPRRTVPELTGFLLRHVDWLAAHDAVADLTTEAGRLARRARGVVEPPPTPGVPVGPCLIEDCAGTLVAHGPGGAGEGERGPVPGGPAGDDPRRTGAELGHGGGKRTGRGAGIVCSRNDGHAWAPWEWVALRSRLAPTGTPVLPAAVDESAPGPAPATVLWLAAGDIARLWEVSTGTVYRLASERRWRRRSRAGRTFYHAEDVRGTFAERGRGRARRGTPES